MRRRDGRKEISPYSQMLQESQLGVCAFGDGRDRPHELCFKPAVWLSGNEENINGDLDVYKHCYEHRLT